jgi:hypothetical protein
MDGIIFNYNMKFTKIYRHGEGCTDSTSFPATPGAFQNIFSGIRDAFVVKIAEIFTDLQ